MPELPEVENIKIGLKPNVVGKRILDVKFSELVINSHLAARYALVKSKLKYFKENIIDKKILSLERRGKYLYFILDKGYMITHFGMTGAYFVVNSIDEIKNKNYNKHRHLIFKLDSGELLVYSDIRRFGELRFVDNIEEFKPFNNLAPEPFSEHALDHFMEKLDSKRYCMQKIKALLLEGSVFCGCGNIYACEILYQEKIHPEKLACELSHEEKVRLFKSLVKMLEFSIEQGGSTISDYVHSDGSEGNMQNFHKIYGKKVCPLGHTVENLIIKTRSSHYCPQCQKK
ncbi:MULTISPECIES: DNA-formamidopyrimidine glycosylase [unclassified Gemella]|uniref:DNA-formamidopyrimidine glycosylase n=1 Tax=unclassified Gemella TaxID=2624949 RepID=UPI0010739A18|nr:MULTISPECIES: DNA-formamidopyrimidine glycosylase [unclassified Gemella]MBF0709691.1 DNA-formamidopyrimidine glycosylase [Gemella sp. GL1.1]MBF0746890.1 DNA-formamidopyrimidine glycosylase [Gemella sp. 19428wG2_WT2a]NYS27035.1 DNA-formamidopyrimidine glycosylase [Gemella sp. GL1]TFU59119.1 DNA-formamidopyrimidine glycosylase [Gemella sp. WT2a]